MRFGWAVPHHGKKPFSWTILLTTVDVVKELTDAGRAEYNRQSACRIDD
jgi:hypothetical protein